MPRIALAQTNPASAPSGPPALEKPHSTSPFPTLDQNLVDVVDFVERAAAEKAEVVVFPEYFLQGIVNEARTSHSLLNTCSPSCATWPSPTGFALWEQSSMALSGPRPSKVTLQQLEWAKYLEQHPLSSEENSTPVLKNTAFFIDEEGVLQGEYVKQNLWHPERDYIVAGIEPRQVFETKWGKAGLLICWDMSHPSAAQELADLGADIIFAPTYWMATDSEPLIHNHPHPTDYETSVVSAMCLTRAFETETVWIMCNAGGAAIEGFMGGSGIWAPLRGRVGGCGAEAGLQIVDVEMGVLKDARQTYKIREDWSKRQAT
ncbi:hypothetical protein I312_105923 [Cryptococcus bacillisporus CA1280]|uniref:uncharacterized protein n=1 Tax=Cryptococcus bacillisporus CA1280 TaxID=1296109 RepID=UPI0033683E45